MGKFPFRPVKGTEEQIATIPITSGQFYCTTDSGKIYLDAKGKRIPMGGSGAAIYYGTAEALNEDGVTGYYNFPKDNLEKEAGAVHTDDIILNKDGKFFRVIDIQDTYFECTLLSVSGGGGDGEVVITRRPSLTVKAPPANLVNGQTLRIYFTATSAKDENGDPIDEELTITYTLAEAIIGGVNQQYSTGTKKVKSGDQNFIELTNLRDSITTVITFEASGPNHEKVSLRRSVSVTTSTLSLNQVSGFSATTRYSPDTVVLKCDVIGSLPKILDFYFDNDLIQTLLLDSNSLTTQECKIDPNRCAHGNHSVRIELYFNSGDSENPIRDTNVQIKPLAYEIAVVRVGNENPIIWLGEYKQTYYNYDTIQIPYMIYNPGNMNEAVVHLYKNDVELQELTITNLSNFNYWEIANADMGYNSYQISCGSTKREITFSVEQDPNRDMEIVKKDNLRFNFEATGRSNQENSTNRQKLEYKGIKAVFKDFNWYNNGWIKGDDNQTCLRISNGAQFEIPIGTMKFGYKSVEEQSNTIEMQIKVRNIQKYSNLITNVTRYKNDKAWYEAYLAQDKYDNYDAYLQATLGPDVYDALEFASVQKNIDLKNIVCGFYNTDNDGGNITGICVGTQDTFFSNGSDTVNVSFVEEDMINLSFVFQYQVTADDTQVSKLLIYINGAITGVIKSTKENFLIDNASIVFNSANCDVDLYKLRVYNTALTVNDICINYAVDRRNVKIYDQNKLATFNNALDEYQLQFSDKDGVQANASSLMPYLIFDTSKCKDDKLPYIKGQDAVKLRVEFVNSPLDLAYERGELEELAKEDKLVDRDETNRDRINEAVKLYYKYHCPSWVSYLSGDNDKDTVDLTLQGTSSQFYPRKNFKGKTKIKADVWTEDASLPEGGKYTQESLLNIYLNRGPFAQVYSNDKQKLKDDKKYYGKEECRMNDGWYFNNYTNSTDRWTFKVDYMESSGTYNAGFANMVATTYSKHPLKDYLDLKAISDEGHKLYSHLGDLRWQDYRTSMAGFPVMAFQKRTDGSYIFIGYYRMLTDKGSDAIMGFKPDKSITSKYVKDTKGKAKKVRDVVECWEFSTNNRTFCSFRDPENRVQLSFKRSPGQSGEFNANMAPSIVDNFEYRYHEAEDSLDMLYEYSAQDQEKINGLMNNIRKDLGLTEEELPTPGPITDKSTPTDEDKRNARIAGNALLRYYANWEKACQWVWSTNLDNVISQGNYKLIAVGKQEYKSNTFYIYNEDTDTYSLDDSDTMREGTIYYERIIADGVVSYKNAYVCKPELVYAKNKYYFKSVVQGKEYYSLATNDFSDSIEYYAFEDMSEEELKEQADLLVAPATGEFNSTEVYYTYNPEAEVNAGHTTGAVVKVEAPNAEDFIKYYVANPVSYGNRTYKYDTREYRAAKFTNELSKHFDPEYLSSYFIMTEVFECYDSRGKNCMMASWGPLEEGGDYIWYPIFYDIDTQLGINNTGIPSFEFNVDATEANNFSTSDSILWNNFYTFYKNSYILAKYQQLRGLKQSQWNEISDPPLKTVDKIESWYNFDPKVTNNIACRGDRPLIATNLDMYFKYITITNERAIGQGVGYIDGDGSMVIDKGGSYFYALQGDRQQSRKQFLTNRLEYIDSWLNQGSYARGGSNNIHGRISANNMDKQTHSDWWVETADSPYWVDKEFGTKQHEFDAQYWVDLTPIRSSYVTIGGDGDFTYPSQKYDGKNAVKFKITEVEHGVRTSPNYPEQLLYLYGMNQMRDIGDLSKLYWAEFFMSGSFNKLTSLRLGYDGLDKDGNRWYNKGLNNLKSLQPMPLLKEINLSNLELREETTLDLRASEKLENFRAIGADNINAINFADGVALDTLYMPKCSTNLVLIQASLLTNLIENKSETIPVKNGEELVVKPGLYIEGFFDADTSKLNTINLLGDSLKEGSFKILKRFYELHFNDSNATRITMQDVNWCPLNKVLEGEEYDSNKTYYTDDGHYGFKLYSYDNQTFNGLILNGELYEGTLPDSYVIDDSGFNILKELQNTDRKFQNVNGEGKPYISGIIYIKNETPIEENKIYELQKKYPKLTFFAAKVEKAYSAKFVAYDEETKSYQYVKFVDENITQPSVQKVSVEQFKTGTTAFTNPLKLYNPIKTHYDFQGWCANPDGTGIIYTKEWTETISEDKFDYIYYAIYKVHNYTMSFFNYNGQSVGELIAKLQIPYNTNIKEPTLIPYRDSSGLSLYEAYDFTGYSLTPGGDKVDITQMIAVSNRSFYATFKKVDDIRTVVHPEWFVFSTDSWNQDDYFSRNEGWIANAIDRVPQTGRIDGTLNGCSISIKPGLTLRGKITLPNQGSFINTFGVEETRPVISIASNFAEAQLITHVFCQPTGSQLLQVHTDAFSNSEHLKYFDFSQNTVRRIGGNAFQNCYLDWDLYTDNGVGLSKNMYIVESFAFNNAFASKRSNAILKVPGNLRYASASAAFAYQNHMIPGGWTLQLGSAEIPSELVYAYTLRNDLGNRDLFWQNDDSENKNYLKNIIIYSKRYSAISDTITHENTTCQLYEFFVKDSGTQQLGDFTFTFFKENA